MVHDEGLEDVIQVDSAGTHSYHIGESPDPRAQQSALRRGLDLSSQRARKFTPDDCEDFDYILVMDKANYREVMALCPAGSEHKVSLFLDYAPHLRKSEVPDPYFGGSEGFELVLELTGAAAQGLLEDIRRRHLE